MIHFLIILALVVFQSCAEESDSSEEDSKVEYEYTEPLEVIEILGLQIVVAPIKICRTCPMNYTCHNAGCRRVRRIFG